MMIAPVLFFFLPALLPLVGLVFMHMWPLVLCVLATRAFLSDCNTDSVDKASTKTAEDKTSKTVHVQSDVRCKLDEHELRVWIYCPGLRASDVNVTVVDDNILRVTGETTKNSDVYRIAKDVQLPRAVLTDAIEATHEDGVLTLVVPRKITRVSIPVTSGVAVPVVAPASETSTESNQEKATVVEDEWEPLPQGTPAD